MNTRTPDPTKGVYLLTKRFSDRNKVYRVFRVSIPKSVRDYLDIGQYVDIYAPLGKLKAAKAEAYRTRRHYCAMWRRLKRYEPSAPATANRPVSAC